MKIHLSTIKNSILYSLLFAMFSCGPLMATETPGNSIGELISSYPYMGLITNEVTYGPITLKKFNLDNNGRIVVAQPGEVINGSVKYKVDTDKLSSPWHLHHVIVGIKGADSQSCITHLLGTWEKKGKASFTLAAPMEKGVYEVRFDYQEALLCSDAITAWKENVPSSSATVGIIIVK